MYLVKHNEKVLSNLILKYRKPTYFCGYMIAWLALISLFRYFHIYLIQVLHILDDLYSPYLSTPKYKLVYSNHGM